MDNSTSSILIKSIEFVDNIVNKHPSNKKYKDYFLVQSYNYLFSQLMYTYLDDQVTKNYQSDIQGPFYQNFKNTVKFNSIKFSNIYDSQYRKDIKLCDFFTDELKRLIKKLCNILTLDYQIKKETDDNLIKFYYFTKTIPVYIELVRNQYEVLDYHIRQIFISEFNNLVKLPAGKITINSPLPNIIPLAAYLRYGDASYGKLTSQEFQNYTKLIDRIYELIIGKVLHFEQSKIPYQPVSEKQKETKSYESGKILQQKQSPQHPHPISHKQPDIKTQKPTKIITKLYNSKIHNITKDILIKACNIKELNISYSFPKKILETTLLDSIKGATLKDKIKNLGFLVEDDVSEDGMKLAIIETILESKP